MPESHANPPPPAQTTILKDAEVTPAMTAWAVQVLSDPSVPLFGIASKTVDGVPLVARKEWHSPDDRHPFWHHGVTLYRRLDGGNMMIKLATIGAKGTDSLELVDTPAKAAGLRAAGVEFVLQYLGTVTRASLGVVLDAGLAFMPVTRAKHFDGPAAVAEMGALALPLGCTVWLDVEDVANMDPAALKAAVNSWATAIVAAGFQAGLYVGAGCPLTSMELYQLKVTRYWKSQSRILDRNGQLAEPSCGWCMLQGFPSTTVAGVYVDFDFVQQDYRNRLPSWTVRAA